jgi:HK97 family phage major capsid protein
VTYAKCFSIQANSQESAEIFIYDQIGKDPWDNSGIEAAEFAKELKSLGKITNLTIRISSGGGSVIQGLSIYNALRNHPAKKTVIIDSIAASVASCIAMAGDWIIMNANSMLMLHDPFTSLSNSNAAELRKTADTLDKVKQSLVSAYTSKTGMTDADISALMEKESWLTAKECFDMRFCDEITEAQKIAASVDLSKFNFKNTPKNLIGGLKNMETIENEKQYKKDLFAERERCSGILAIAREFKISNEITNRFVDEGKTCDDFRLHILNEIRNTNPSQGPSFSNIGNPMPMYGARPFRSFGEQLQAIKNASVPGGRVDQRLFEISNAAAGMGEVVPSEGGFVVQQDFTTALLEKANETAVLAPLCMRIPVSGSGLKAPVIDETSRATGSRFGGVLSYWTPEGGSITAKKPKIAMLELSLKKLMGVCYATDELLSDQSALDAVISRAFSEEIGFMLDSAIVSGAGAGEPLGLLNANCLVTVAKETGQLADTIVSENVINMYSRMWRGGKKNGVWLVNAQCWPQLFQMQLTIGTGGLPLYMPPQGLSQSPYGTLFGRPVIECEQCEALGDVGDIIFADMSQYLLIDKGGLNAEASVHVRFLTDETTFRFVYRTDGQALWKSALTPYKGSSSTVSPFIALQAR